MLDRVRETAAEAASVTEQISASSGQMAASAEEQSAQAEDLEVTAEQLREGVDAFVIEARGPGPRRSDEGSSSRPEAQSAQSGTHAGELHAGGNGRAA